MLRALLIWMSFIYVGFGLDFLTDKQVEMDKVYYRCTQSLNTATCIISVMGDTISEEQTTENAVLFLDRHYEDIAYIEDYQMASYFQQTFKYLTQNGYPVDRAMKDCSSAAAVYAIYFETKYAPNIKRSDEEYAEWAKSVCQTSVQTFVLGLE